MCLKRRGEKKAVQNQDVLCVVAVCKRGGGGERERERFKDRGDEMCDMR